MYYVTFIFTFLEDTEIYQHCCPTTKCRKSLSKEQNVFSLRPNNEMCSQLLPTVVPLSQPDT